VVVAVCIRAATRGREHAVGRIRVRLLGRVGAHVDQLAGRPEVRGREAAVHDGVVPDAIGPAAFPPRVTRDAAEGIRPHRDADAAERRARDRPGARAAGRPVVAAGVAARGAGIVGREDTPPARAAVLVPDAAEELVVGAFAPHLRRAEDRHADGAVRQAVPVGVDQRAGVTRVAAPPVHVVELPPEGQGRGGRGAGRARLAPLVQVLLARHVVRT